MACYDFDYAIRSLRQAIDFAEIEDDYVPLRKWAREVELSGHELETSETRFFSPSGQAYFADTLASIACGALTPEEGCQLLRNWITANHVLSKPVEASPHYQPV